MRELFQSSLPYYFDLTKHLYTKQMFSLFGYVCPDNHIFIDEKTLQSKNSYPEFTKIGLCAVVFSYLVIQIRSVFE